MTEEEKQLPVDLEKPGVKEMGIALLLLPRRGPVPHRPGAVQEILARLVEAVPDETLESVGRILYDAQRDDEIKYQPSYEKLIWMCGIARNAARSLALVTIKHSKIREREQQRLELQKREPKSMQRVQLKRKAGT
jgi:hypothetical protein